MSKPRKLLLVGGLLLTLWGMSYGLYYALFDEHQTLVGIGDRLTAAFAAAAERQIGEAHPALEAYAATRFEYIREVDVHSHWSGLALLLVLLGLIFDHVALPERLRLYLAAMLVAGSILFPLGIILQIIDAGWFPQALAAAGAGLVIVALSGVAVGFARRGPPATEGRNP